MNNNIREALTRLVRYKFYREKEAREKKIIGNYSTDYNIAKKYPSIKRLTNQGVLTEREALYLAHLECDNNNMFAWLERNIPLLKQVIFKLIKNLDPANIYLVEALQNSTVRSWIDRNILTIDKICKFTPTQIAVLQDQAIQHWINKYPSKVKQQLDRLFYLAEEFSLDQLKNIIQLEKEEIVEPYFLHTRRI